jgi:hypothetical protein
LKSRSLNLEPQGLSRPVMGLLYLLQIQTMSRSTSNLRFVAMFVTVKLHLLYACKTSVVHTHYDTVRKTRLNFVNW